jgi:hypothetical protein
MKLSQTILDSAPNALRKGSDSWNLTFYQSHDQAHHGINRSTNLWFESLAKDIDVQRQAALASSVGHDERAWRDDKNTTEHRVNQGTEELGIAHLLQGAFESFH